MVEPGHVANPQILEREQAFLTLVEEALCFTWASQAGAESLDFILSLPNKPHLYETWLASRIYMGESFEGLLAERAVLPRSEQMWEALKRVGELDATIAWDAALEYHLEAMTLQRWKELFFLPGEPGDGESLKWIVEHEDWFSSQAGYDGADLIRLLRRYDYGGEPFYTTEEVLQIEAMKQAGEDYTSIAATILEISQAYDGAIDASVVSRMTLDWSKTDFTAASDWLLKHGQDFSDRGSLESMLGTMYRHKAQKDPEFALSEGIQIADESLRALALSNIVIPQMERQGIETSVEWVRELPEGLPKARSIAGYILGLSRYRQDAALEAQVKAQFLKEEYRMEQLVELVNASNLNVSEKRSALELVASY